MKKKDENRTGINIFGRYPLNQHWSNLTEFCYKRGCICTGCPNYKIVQNLESGNYCHVKASVLELVRLYGKPPKRRKRVRCVETGEIFESAADAAARSGFTRGWLSEALQKGRTCGGYHFEYITN